MVRAYESMMCEQLKELLRTVAAGEEREQVIAGHMATCPVCATAETALTELIARYRQTELSPLPADLEHRLLDLLSDTLKARDAMRDTADI